MVPSLGAMALEPTGESGKDLSAGLELTRRDLDEPVFILFDDPPRTDFEDREEEFHRLYLYWTPSERWGVTGELIYDNYESDIGEATEFGDLPEKVRTVSLPIAATYFHPSGFFGGIQGTYVDQEVRRSPNSLAASGKDNFFVVDLAIGYRFPKRYGIASLGIRTCLMRSSVTKTIASENFLVRRPQGLTSRADHNGSGDHQLLTLR